MASASITFNTPPQQHQKHLLCKCPSPLNTFNFYFFTPKHTPPPSLFLVKAHVRNIERLHESTSTSTLNLKTRKKVASGFSSSRDNDNNDRVVDKNSMKNLVVVEEDKKIRKNMGFRKRREMGTSSSGNNIWIKSSKTMEKKTNGHHHYKVREKHMDRGNKKNKSSDPLEVQFRVDLDMCSKRGDVMGAIQWYDKALSEGIKLSQYHYNVLLYLCSSAAVGVVKPAKSGSDSRTLDTLAITNDNNGELVDCSSSTSSDKMIDEMESDSSDGFDELDSSSAERENMSMKAKSQPLSSGDQIRLSEDVKRYALQRGFEIYEKMCLDKVPMNEASLTALGRMAMSMGNGDMAFDMVKKMKPLGINPRLRSYGPALAAFCSSGDIDKAFDVEKHMLEHGVYPEEPELEALLRVSVGAGKGDKVYYLLHKLRTTVRKVSSSTADIIEKWFNGKEAARLGKTKWDQRLIKETMESKGGGWHGQGWLGKGKWNVSRTTVAADALCKCCGEKLAMIDLDPVETENFAESVASIAIKREKNSSFQRFQKWLDYYGPFEAVVDAANVGLFSQRGFKPSRVNAVVNGIRQTLPTKKWPLIILHHKRITGQKMDQPMNKAFIEKWKNADALYATPTGSNDDWYWLYAAIKFKCLLVTNDEMRDHTFQLLGNDFFPRWKERHQVRFGFSDAGPEFYMPPPCSVVIQESEKGNWHIPIESEHDYETERTWLCITRAKSLVSKQNSATRSGDLQPVDHGQATKTTTAREAKTKKSRSVKDITSENTEKPNRKISKNLKNILSASSLSNHPPILSEVDAAEKLGDCVIDFQI